jgi:hypothetical protein
MLGTESYFHNTRKSSIITLYWMDKLPNKRLYSWSMVDEHKTIINKFMLTKLSLL